MSVDYFKKVDFNRTVFVPNFDTNEVEKITYAELVTQYAETTTSRIGIAPKMHSEGNKLMAYDQWGGNKGVYDFETEVEAAHAVLLCHEWDYENGDSPACFSTLEEAEEDLL